MTFPTSLEGLALWHAHDDLLRSLVLALDLAGTFAFALSGGTAGVRRNLDIFGILLLSFAASTSGGMMRDLLIGATPPAALSDWRYLAVSLLAGIICFFGSSLIERLRNPVRLLDAMGLALFAVAGTEKALGFGMHPFGAALMGMLTGIGGGIARDVLLAEVPAVLRAEFYALAALAGAAVVVAGHLLDLPVIVSTLSGGLLCFGLRIAAMRRGWNLPVAPHRRAQNDNGLTR